MLHKIILQCETPQGYAPHYEWGFLLHGFLMKQLSQGTGDFLHDGGARPFSQYVEVQDHGHFRWHIGVWHDAIAEEIETALNKQSAIALFIKDRFILAKILHMDCAKQTEEAFLERFFRNAYVPARYEISFTTPTTHRSDGAYASYPTPELIYRSLAVRFSAFSTQYEISDMELVRTFAQNTAIVGYALYSAKYMVKNVRVPGYTGRLTLQLRMPEEQRRLGGMLLSLAAYQGIGIKTALGMGGCRVNHVDNANRSLQKIT